MEWWIILLIILGSLIMLLITGLPVAFCFMLINLVGAHLFWGGEAGLRHLSYSFISSICHFTLIPIPLFILMGEVMFHSGIAIRTMAVLDKWLGRVTGRLALLAVAGGTMFASVSGSSVAGAAMLGSVLVPEMEKQGYAKSMSIGPILGSGGLSIMIPPTALGILLASLAHISVGDLLIAIVVPGLLMAAFYAGYIIIRCWLQPSIAPVYDIASASMLEKVVGTAKYVLPLGSIVFLVVGVIFLGVASPSEAAALGALGCFILAFLYGGLNWDVVKKAVLSTARVTVMVFMILAGAMAFSQVLSYSGATRGLTESVVTLPLSPIAIVIVAQVVVLMMGTFMESLSIMMVTLPVLMPIVRTLGFDPLWFGVLMLLNIEMGQTTPPFGMTLFVMKGVAPAGTKMGEIYRAGLPFLGCDAVVMGLLILFPMIAVWLPNLMR